MENGGEIVLLFILDLRHNQLATEREREREKERLTELLLHKDRG